MPGLAQRHQDVAARELNFSDLMPLARHDPVVGDPQVAVLSTVIFVRDSRTARRRTSRAAAGRVEVQDGIDRRVRTVGAAGSGDAAAIDRPDRAVRRDRNTGRRSPTCAPRAAVPMTRQSAKGLSRSFRAERRHRWHSRKLQRRAARDCVRTPTGSISNTLAKIAVAVSIERRSVITPASRTRLIYGELAGKVMTRRLDARPTSDHMRRQTALSGIFVATKSRTASGVLSTRFTRRHAPRACDNHRVRGVDIKQDRQSARRRCRRVASGFHGRLQP